MDPMMLLTGMSALGKLFGGGGAATPTPAAAPPQANPAAMQGNGMDTLTSLMGSIQPQEPHRTPMPQTTFPEVPRSMNPQYTQMVMQALMSGQGAPQMPSLGQLLAGRA